MPKTVTILGTENIPHTTVKSANMTYPQEIDTHKRLLMISQLGGSQNIQHLYIRQNMRNIRIRSFASEGLNVSFKSSS